MFPTLSGRLPGTWIVFFKLGLLNSEDFPGVSPLGEMNTTPVVSLDPEHNPVSKVFLRVPDFAFDHVACQDIEPALGLVEPRGACGGREMERQPSKS